MDYGKVLTRAWEITWRWKVLWILGFLAALGSGGGGGSSGGSTSYTTTGDDLPYWWGHTYLEPHIPPGLVAAIIGLACVAIFIGIAIWVVSVIARGGLIAGVQQAEEEGHTSFGLAWRAGARRFWTLFGIGILAAIPMIILAVVALVVLIMMFVGSGFAFTSSDAGITGIVTSILCGGVFCCGMVILAIILQQIRIYAERAAIVEDLGWIESFSRGWNVLKANLGPTIVFWLIFFALGIAFLIATAVILAATAFPFIALVTNIDAGAWIFAPICCGGLLAIIVAALISAIVQTFSSATWTLAYRDMVELAAPPAAEPPEELLLELDEEPAPEE